MIHTFTQQVCLCANQEQVLTNSVKEFVFLHGGDTSSINKFFEWASHCKALIGGCTYQKTLKSLSPRLCKIWTKQELQVRSSRLCIKPDRDANTCWCIYSFCRGKTDAEPPFSNSPGCCSCHVLHGFRTCGPAGHGPEIHQLKQQPQCEAGTDRR